MKNRPITAQDSIPIQLILVLSATTSGVMLLAALTSPTLGSSIPEEDAGGSETGPQGSEEEDESSSEEALDWEEFTVLTGGREEPVCVPVPIAEFPLPCPPVSGVLVPPFPPPPPPVEPPGLWDGGLPALEPLWEELGELETVDDPWSEEVGGSGSGWEL